MYCTNEIKFKLKLEFILKLKIKRNDWLLADKQPIVTLYFEFETVLMFLVRNIVFVNARGNINCIFRATKLCKDMKDTYLIR